MIEIISEGMRIFSRNIDVKINGLKKYSGTDEEICRQIIAECYDPKKKHFNASGGNYKVFYSRDFGWCIESLIRLGYKDMVDDTLKYSMDKYSKCGRITVAINKAGKCFNFPDVYSPDSVAYFFRSLRMAKSVGLIAKNVKFLNSEIKKFENIVLDASGLIRDRVFSGMRDHNKNTMLCYDMMMACMLKSEIDKINKLAGKPLLINALSKHPLKENLLKYYWNGKYFIDSIYGRYCSGHTNVYPYFLGLFDDDAGKNEMIRSSIAGLRKSNLDEPIPLKYGYDDSTKFAWYNIFAPDWEKDTSWAMLGLAYIDIVSRIDKRLARKYLSKYTTSINKNKCFIELYDGNEPYASLFFSSDDSMLWASMYLDLKQRLARK